MGYGLQATDYKLWATGYEVRGTMASPENSGIPTGACSLKPVRWLSWKIPAFLQGLSAFSTRR